MMNELEALAARESSQPRVEADGYVQLSLAGKVSAKCSAQVAVLIEGSLPTVTGGQQITRQIKTVADWCEYYGVQVSRGCAQLYKAVSDEYKSFYNGGLVYQPGTTVTADDWDGGKQECGKGLHFSPHPSLAKGFANQATKYVACSVALRDLAIHPDGEHPHKCKASQCRVIEEVDGDGEPVA